jgi:hypothetical protein
MSKWSLSPQTQALGLAVAAILLIVKAKQHSQFVRVHKKIPPPLWAKDFWHLVPVELHHELTREDWGSFKRIVPFKMPLFCSQLLLQSNPHSVYLSVTTSPDRIKYLPITLNCLNLERVKEIQVNLPRRFGRNQKEYSNIPDYVLQYPKLRIYWHDTDDGPLMKILNTVERVSPIEPDAICIAIDDDMCYPRMHVDSLISAHLATQGNAVIGGKGANVANYFRTGYRSQQVKDFEAVWPTGVDHLTLLPGTDERNLMEGFGAIAYRARHLNPSRLRQLAAAHKKCFTSDDLTLNYHMQEQGITRFVINQFSINGLSYGNKEDALHLIQSHHDVYPVCVDAITRTK